MANEHKCEGCQCIVAAPALTNVELLFPAGTDETARQDKVQVCYDCLQRIRTAGKVAESACFTERTKKKKPGKE